MAKIRFYAETGNRTIVEGHARIRHGWNEMEEDSIRLYSIDTLPYVKMPADWITDAPMYVTTAVAPEITVTETPVEFEYQAAARSEPTSTLEKRTEEIQKQAKSKLWGAARIISMDPKRAKVEIEQQTDVKKLVELLQFAKSKPSYKKMVIARIKELDPTSPWVEQTPAAETMADGTE